MERKTTHTEKQNERDAHLESDDFTIHRTALLPGWEGDLPEHLIGSTRLQHAERQAGPRHPRRSPTGRHGSHGLGSVPLPAGHGGRPLECGDPPVRAGADPAAIPPHPPRLSRQSSRCPPQLLRARLLIPSFIHIQSLLDRVPLRTLDHLQPSRGVSNSGSSTLCKVRTEN